MSDVRSPGSVIAVVDDDDQHAARTFEAAAEMALAHHQPLLVLLLQRRDSCPESVGLSLSTPCHYAVPPTGGGLAGLTTSCQPVDQAASAWIRAVAEMSGASTVVVADRTSRRTRIATWLRWLAVDLVQDLGGASATFSVVGIESAR